MSKLMQCARDGCTQELEVTVHNKRFCNAECTRLYTNARILAQYHENKTKIRKNRVCSTTSCKTILSIYNEDKYCSVHAESRLRAKLTSWGWTLDEDWVL